MLVISDTHTNFKYLIDAINHTSEKNIILLGDHGFGEDGNYGVFSTDVLYSLVENAGKHIYCIAGNHDNQSHMDDIYGLNYIHCIRTSNGPKVYTIEDKQCLFVPGAYSFDKQLQIAQNSWYENEEMAYVMMRDFEDTYVFLRHQIEYLFSHDTSINNYEYLYHETTPSFTNQFMYHLYTMSNKCIPKIHGHLHIPYYDYDKNVIGLGINQSMLLK